MLNELPTELLWAILNYLEYDDIAKLSTLGDDYLTAVVTPYLQTHYRFHWHVSRLLLFYESLTRTERIEGRPDLAQQLLHVLCHIVQQYSKFEQRAKFTQLLDVLQHLVVQRVLCPTLQDDLDKDYALLCLDIRHRYLHTASIRGLHDPKYRRRSTKHPLAPFLPRDYTWIWRQHCGYINEWISPKVPQLNISWNTISNNNHITTTPVHQFLLRRRKVGFQFARFFGMLFDITSLYLESNLDGTFEECVREALVSGNVEGLLLLCMASDRPVDVDMMCMSVSHAGEQLWNYLDTMDDWMATHPTPEQLARQEQAATIVENQDQDPPVISSPPEWLMPDRYKIQADTKFRLKMIHYLHQQGWRWFP
ncbi:hypothetical protein BC941DRAFT_446267 [Chlamydoabsidia padenii]|nr:hypothetical protein BC941DRAFT_446267 [Chlamydoabsidia padenii]